MLLSEILGKRLVKGKKGRIFDCKYVCYDINSNSVCLSKKYLYRYCVDTPRNCKWKRKSESQKNLMIFENEKEMEHIYSLLDDMAIVKPNKSSKLEEARDYDLLSQPMNCNGLYYCEREEVNLKIDLYESAIKELQDEIVLLKQDKNDLSLAHEEEIKQMINTYNVGMEENLKQYEDLIKEMEDENKGLKQQIDGFKNNE